MGQERPVRTYEISGLEMSHLDGSTYLNLPKVYMQDEIPVSKENIPTKKDLERWPYLSRIQLDEIDADIELLIGIDVPKAMEPWEIINSEGNGPYAVKTLFGWVVNGPLSSCSALNLDPIEYQSPISRTFSLHSITKTSAKRSMTKRKKHRMRIKSSWRWHVILLF